VRVDHRDDRSARSMRVVEVKSGFCCLASQQRVDDDEAGIALNDRHVGQVEAAELVNPVDDLEQPADSIELSHPPQARVDRGRCLLGSEEFVVAQVPDDLAGRSARNPIGQRRDQPAPRILEIAPVLKRQHRPKRRVRRPRARFGILRCGCHGAPPSGANTSYSDDRAREHHGTPTERLAT